MVRVHLDICGKCAVQVMEEKRGRIRPYTKAILMGTCTTCLKSPIQLNEYVKGEGG